MSVRDLTILGSSSQQPTRDRNHGAYLIRWNEEGFLFDPGEGTQRQFIFANVAPPCVTRIFVSHFHGDHCLGLGSMLMRLNLDRVSHPVHCYYPASGKKYFQRLRYGTMYHDTVQVIEHPIEADGVVHEDEGFVVEAYQLNHGVDCLGYRVKEKNRRKFYKDKLKDLGIRGPMMRDLQRDGELRLADGRLVGIDEVSYIKTGDVFAYISDTLPCEGARMTAKGAKMLLCESTYLNEHRELAHKHFHMTAGQAALIAKEAAAEQLIMTHFSARYRDVEGHVRESREIFENSHAAEDLTVFDFPR